MYARCKWNFNNPCANAVRMRVNMDGKSQEVQLCQHSKAKKNKFGFCTLDMQAECPMHNPKNYKKPQDKKRALIRKANWLEKDREFKELQKQGRIGNEEIIGYYGLEDLYPPLGETDEIEIG